MNFFTSNYISEDEGCENVGLGQNVSFHSFVSVCLSICLSVCLSVLLSCFVLQSKGEISLVFIYLFTQLLS